MLLLLLFINCSGDHSSQKTVAPLGANDWDKDGYTENDCDDGDAAVHPGAIEVCDGKDNDCKGGTDEGFPALCEKK